MYAKLHLPIFDIVQIKLESIFIKFLNEKQRPLLMNKYMYM